MSKRAQDYVMSLAQGRVNRHQHHLLLVLAFHQQEARETFWPSHKTLAQRCHINDGEGNESDQRQVRRLVQECVALGILLFESGVGRGNRGSYKFRELETRSQQTENRTQQSSFEELNPDLKPDTKQDNPQPVRGIEVNLTKPFTKAEPLQEQNQNQTLPNPPLQGGNKITYRTLGKLKAQIEASRRKTCKLHPGARRTQSGQCWGCYAEQLPVPAFFPVEDDELQEACHALLLNFDEARQALDQVLYPRVKKEPQSVSA